MATPAVQGTPQVTSFTATSGTVTLTGVQAGETLLAWAAGQTGTRTMNTVEDDRNGAWSEIVDSATSTQVLEGSIWRRANAAAGDTIITFTPNLSSAWSVAAMRVANCSITPDDVNSELVDSVSTTDHNASATADDIDTAAEVIVLVLGISQVDRGAITCTGYTIVTGTSNDDLILFAYKTSAGALTNERGLWTHATGALAASCIASFKADAAGAVGHPMMRRRAHVPHVGRFFQ